MMRYLSLLLLALIATSCSSPLAIDTPRDKSLDSLVGGTRVRVTSMELTFGSINSLTQYTFSTSGTAIIDTGGAEPVLWLTLTGTAPAGSEGSMPMRAITFHFDSLVPGNAPISVVGTPADKIGAEMTTEWIPGIPEQRNPDGTSCHLTMAFTHDRGKRTLEATVNADPQPGGRPMLINGTLTLGY